ncbi:MAG: hypothetical protein ABI675_11515 [Chitinophagaceae bacterium]
MKLVFAALLLAAIVIGCNSPQKKETLSMAGAYKMLSQNVKSDSLDTTYTSLQQMKIYTDDYMMYANVNSPDSISSFGIGSYTVNGDTVTENVIYNASDSSKNDSPGSFTVLIEKTAKGYKQVIPEIQSGNQKFKLTEEYDAAGTESKSPLDGAWKLVKRLEIKGTDTVVNQGVEYKTYYAGQCIWGNTWQDSLKKTHTGIGFGKFEMVGPNKVKESMIASTYSEVRGHDFDINIEMNGTDGFTQTTDYGSAGKGVEVYQRLKK